MKYRRNPRKNMIQIEDKLVSGELQEEFFACDVLRCKGACCVEGDLGAPLDRAELEVLDQIYETVKPYLREEGIRAIEEQGNYVLDFTGGYSTTLVEGRECAYATFTPEGIALCGIEQAWQEGKIDFQKPVSCHLYPVRISSYATFEALNYDRWDICSAACSKGAAGGIRVYEFVKDALIRKYGEDFYLALDTVIKDQLAQKAAGAATSAEEA